MAEDPRVSLQQADAFLDLHEDWPAKSRIQSFVESRIPKNAPVDDVLAFFESRDPVTGSGKVHLARALFAKGEQDAGEVHLRDAWVNDNFTVSEERAVLSSYGGRLTEEDHAARVDRSPLGATGDKRAPDIFPSSIIMNATKPKPARRSCSERQAQHHSIVNFQKTSSSTPAFCWPLFAIIGALVMRFTPSRWQASRQKTRKRCAIPHAGGMSAGY